MNNEIVRIFNELYGSQGDIRLFFAPGRVNLIGEHIDYNGGHVLPCALTIGTYAVVRKREDRLIRFYSHNFSKMGIIEKDMDQLFYFENDDWVNYTKGIISTFEDEGYKFDCGFDIAYYGNIPNGAGLSSSASIELVTCVMLKNLYKLKISMEEMIRLSKKTENEYIGVNCGVMDQFIIGMGKKEHSILLNTLTMDYKYVKFNLDEYSIIIGNTNKRRGLASSKYNERFLECQKALEQMKKVIDINKLCDLSIKQFEENKDVIEDIIIQKRVKHVVYENYRTIRAYAALELSDFAAFGKLMNESHSSLKNDYEVTGIELDTLVELAQNLDGVIGARMTGAGFGGCTVNLVKRENVDSVIESLSCSYREKIGYDPCFYIVSIGDGAKEIRI